MHLAHNKGETVFNKHHNLSKTFHYSIVLWNITQSCLIAQLSNKNFNIRNSKHTPVLTEYWKPWFKIGRAATEQILPHWYVGFKVFTINVYCFQTKQNILLRRTNNLSLNRLNAELNPICHLLVLLGGLTFMGPCIVYIFQYTCISNKVQCYTVYLYLETALHVSGGTCTHHQERIQLYL
jgi:hypothetical protein